MELRQYESDGAGEGDRGHREEVGVLDQVAHKGGEAAQGSRSPERVLNSTLFKKENKVFMDQGQQFWLANSCFWFLC